MWELYDDLIKELPDDIYPTRLFQSGHCTICEIDGKIGATVTNPQYNYKPMIEGFTEQKFGFKPAPMAVYKSLNWKELGRLIKSWNFKEASIGAAAINAYYNQMDKLNNMFMVDKNDAIATGEANIHMLENPDPFDSLEKIGKDKIIATIGHFGTKKPCFSTCKELRIIERNAKFGDLPDSSCEYLLADADIVIVTGFTLINKTLPRLLELSKNAKVIYMGPSCTIAPVLFKYGVNEIASSVFSDFDDIKQRARTRTHKILVKIGEEVCVSNFR